jgi:hypothetical protein
MMVSGCCAPALGSVGAAAKAPAAPVSAAIATLRIQRREPIRQP